MPQLLKPVRLEPVLHKRSHRSDKKKPPLATARGSPHVATKTQCSQNFLKIKKQKKKSINVILYIILKKINFENIMLSERSQSQKITNGIITII